MLVAIESVWRSAFLQRQKDAKLFSRTHFLPQNAKCRSTFTLCEEILVGHGYGPAHPAIPGIARDVQLG